MAEKTVDVQRIKERLLQYMRMVRNIDNQIERLERMEAAMTSPPSPNLSGMPAGGTSADRIAVLVGRKTELDARIRKEIGEEQEERAGLEALVEQLKQPDERQVIYLKYFDRLDWPEICRLLFSDQCDYTENMDRYKRRTYRLHGRALYNLAILENKAPEQ